jgi:hypothetical protein
MATAIGCRLAWFSWLVDGYIGYAQEGINIMPPEVIERTESFRRNVSEFHTFIYDLLVHDQTSVGIHMPFRRVYSAYEAWCFENRISAQQKLSSIAFSRKLRDNGFEIEKRRPRVNDIGFDPNSRNSITFVQHTGFIRPDESEGSNRKFDMDAFEQQFKGDEK